MDISPLALDENTRYSMRMSNSALRKERKGKMSALNKYVYNQLIMYTISSSSSFYSSKLLLIFSTLFLS